MKPVSEVTFCVVDTGLFFPMAMSLARQAKRVIFWNHDRRSFPSVKQAVIGDGFPNIDVVNSIAGPPVGEVDCYVFPDIGASDLQLDLIARGKPVWGSRTGDALEMDRERLMSFLKDAGLDVPTFEVMEGWSALCSHLVDKKDKYVKISTFRGDMETTHWRSWDHDQQWLYSLAITFGSVKELIRFLVFDAIDTDLEIGCDTYNVNGQWPDLMLNGFEGKDKCYFAAVTKREDMPDQIKELLESVAPFLKEHDYRNQISFEDRVVGDKHNWIDATQRGGKPSSESQYRAWKNFPDIVWHGANGELLQPKPSANFTIECMITSKCRKDLWDEVEIDPKLVPWVGFSNCCYVDGKYCFPPDECHEGNLGWLVALGDTPTEALDNIKDLADMLPDGLSADVESLAGIIQEIDKANQEDIHFTSEPVPEPASVL